MKMLLYYYFINDQLFSFIRLDVSQAPSACQNIIIIYSNWKFHLFDVQNKLCVIFKVFARSPPPPPFRPKPDSRIFMHWTSKWSIRMLLQCLPYRNQSLPCTFPCIRVEHEFIDYCIHLFPKAYLAQIRLASVLISFHFLRYEMVAPIVVFRSIQNIY